MRAIVYLRVSTAGQATEGVSLDAQRARAEAWAVANGYTVEHVYCDAGVSGKRTSNRPQLRMALQDACRERGTVLIAYSLSRIARSTRDALAIAEQLAKAGADLVSLTERLDTTNAAGKMMFRMLAVLSEFERDLISERTRAALTFKASKNERTGQVPFGKHLNRDGVLLVDDAGEQLCLADIRRLRRSGTSWEGIAVELNRRRVPSKRGSPWSWQTCRNVGLRNGA